MILRKNLFILSVFVIFSFLFGSDAVQVKFQMGDIAKATVVHVFQDLSDNQVAQQRIAKVRISGQNETKDIALIELNPNTTVNIGDQIVIARLENAETMGMGDSFENKYSFLDFARDGVGYFILVLLSFSVFLINKKVLPIAGLFFANTFALLVILPFFMEIRIPVLISYALFLVGNGYGLQYVLKSGRYKTALWPVISGVIGTSLIYMYAAQLCELKEYVSIQNILQFSTISNLQSVDGLAVAIPAIIIFTYTTLFFIKISYTNNIYDNFRRIFFNLGLLYGSLLLGLTLPTIIFFTSNGLGLFYIFNYPPFMQIFLKLSILFIGNIATCALYLMSFYIKNKQHFQKHFILPGRRTAARRPDLAQILTDERVAKYNEWRKAPSPRRVKAKVRLKRIRRIKKAKAKRRR